MRVLAVALLGLALGCAGGAETPAPRLEATPTSGLLDEPLRLAVTGAPAHGRVTIKAVAREAGGRSWAAARTIVADRTGGPSFGTAEPCSRR